MTNIKDLQTMLAGNIDYKNFSEEVTIVSETKSNAGYSLYTITNKNGVTFQNVPGNSDITAMGVLGFINGDRGRPQLLGAGTKVNNTASTVASVWTDIVNITSSITLQPANADNYLRSFSPDNNQGSSLTNHVNSRSTVIERTILNFDFSVIPDNATIDSAILSMYYYARSFDPVGRTYWAYRITEIGWTHLGSTWNNYNGIDSWATGGGDFTTDDGASTVVPAALDNWMDWTVTDQVQYALDNVNGIGHFLIKDGDETTPANSRAIYRSSDYTGDDSLRPKLLINYTFTP